MAKKDKKASPLPKQVDGVKVPKALRRQYHGLAELVRHPLVADLVAAGLVALAARLREDPKPAKPAKAADGEAPAKSKPAKRAAAEKPAATPARKPRAKPRAAKAPAAPAAGETTH